MSKKKKKMTKKKSMVKMEIGVFKVHLDSLVGLVSEMVTWDDEYIFHYRTATGIQLFALRAIEADDGWQFVELFDYPSQDSLLIDVRMRTDTFHATKYQGE